MNDHTSCTFLSSGVGYGRRAGYPTSKVLGANERIRVGMIGVGDSPSIWQTFLQEQRRLTLEDAKATAPEF